MSDDPDDVTCEMVREDLSAAFDGASPNRSDAVIKAHLAACGSCRAFADSIAGLRRAGNLRVAGRTPDLSAEVVRRVAREDRDTRSVVVRSLLALVAVQIAVLAVPDFLSTIPDSHALRHLGAFSLAYATGLLVVVARPARSRTMLGVSVVLITALVATAVYDVIQGRVPLMNETAHLLEVFSTLFLWMLARPLPPAGSGVGQFSADAQHNERSHLRAVTDESA